MDRLDAVKDEPGATLPANDAERWIAATYAIWSEYCGGSCRYLGGYEKTKENARMLAKVLEDDWMVTNHKNGVEMVEYLLENAGPGGCDDDDPEENEYSDDDEYDEDDNEDYDIDDEEYDEDDDDGDDVLEVDTTAFDYACACNMCGRMFITGYFTREESVRYAAEAAKKIQELYSSWEEYYQDYIVGASRGDMEKVMQYFAAYQKVIMSQNSPFGLAWNTQL